MTLVWRPGFSGLTDADAIAYVSAVETADGQPLEFGVAKAINDFVVGCKLDGIWSAIKASCILAGARTLSGALVPLVGTAPTPYFFVEGDYNRKTGLVGDGSTKYLSSNRNASADPLNSLHVASYVSTVGTGALIGPTTTTTSYVSISGAATRSRTSTGDLYTLTGGFVGTSRSNSSAYDRRNNAATTTISSTSLSTDGGITLINGFGGSASGTHRLAFYSIGESIDLTKLDARVSALITAIGAAIP
jgi:hypothetical protein